MASAPLQKAVGTQPMWADLWSVNHVPAAATQATATRAAGAAGVRHVAQRVIASISTVAATAQTPLLLHLRDGATGAGTILASWSVAALGTTWVQVDVGGLWIVGTAATAMTLEFAAAGVANSQAVVTLVGFDLA